MASEAKRGCGYRKVGGLYLVGEYIAVSCDRLPLRLEACPVCGAGIHFTRSMTEINPYRLFGNHDTELQGGHDDISGNYGELDVAGCKDRFRPCHVCDPPDAVAFLMMVGEKYYTPESFIEEAGQMGVCKRIPFIPKKLKLGETIVYLAHPKACVVKEVPILQQAMALVGGTENSQPKLLEAEKEEKALGIFCAFIPQRVEKLVWESELEGEQGQLYKESLEERGITLVPIPDGDADHT